MEGEGTSLGLKEQRKRQHRRGPECGRAREQEKSVWSVVPWSREHRWGVQTSSRQKEEV